MHNAFKQYGGGNSPNQILFEFSKNKENDNSQTMLYALSFKNGEFVLNELMSWENVVLVNKVISQENNILLEIFHADDKHTIEILPFS